jgi:hypothetical protein
VEVRRISEALRKRGNNRQRVAAELGISRMGLYKKLHTYGLFEPAAAAAQPGADLLGPRLDGSVVSPGGLG